MELELTSIRVDGGTQSRLELSQEVVNEYAEHMAEGDVFPAVIVFQDGANYWLADGFHRYFATKKNKGKTINADVQVGTQEEAILFSFTANSNRGLRMTSADKRNIVIRMLTNKTWGGWTDAAIARHVGITGMTVGRIRKGLNKTEKPKKENVPKEEIYRLEPVQEDSRVEELSETVDQLAQENERLKDKIAVGQWDATEIEKIDVEELIAGLREQIRILEIDNKALRESRDMYQARNAELMKAMKK
jgi:predicted RNase H-like nuclease (RuvC/YqgF family)